MKATKTMYELVRDYMRFGQGGEYVEGDINHRRIERVWTNYKDTTHFICYCFENGKTVGIKEDDDAVNWVLEGEVNDIVFCE